MAEQKTVTNTAKTERNEQWLGGGNPGAIEAQESRGQAELVNSEQLPVDCSGDTEAFESLGFVFGEPSADDPLFCEATLPTGWSKRSTEHAMWSEIVDDTDTVRASIFYKAAFYDRCAFMRLSSPAATE